MCTRFTISNVAHYNYKCHSDTAGVDYRLLAVNIVVFRLYILNKHRYIINYSNGLPATFSLILVYFVFLLQKMVTGTVHKTINENLSAINSSLNFAQTFNFPLIAVTKSLMLSLPTTVVINNKLFSKIGLFKIIHTHH